MDDGPNLLKFLQDISLVYPGLGKDALPLLEVIPSDIMDNVSSPYDNDSDDNNDTLLSDIDDRLPSEDSQPDPMDDENRPVIPLDADKIIREKLPSSVRSQMVINTVGGFQLQASEIKHLQGVEGNKWLDDSVINAYCHLISTNNQGVVILPEFVTRRLLECSSVDSLQQTHLDALSTPAVAIFLLIV